jgi:putative aldouronate transport system substrate-binding protein
MRKRIIGVFLTVLLLCGARAALASTFTMAGFDGQDSSHKWSENHFFTRMQETTGTSFAFEQYDDAKKWQDAKDAMFAGGELPDVLFKADLSVEEQTAYSDAGMLIDLLPLLEEHAPNLWALLEANPEWLAAITLPNGKIAALPAINLLPAQNAMWINQTWLDALNLEPPKDFESLLSVLEAFKTKDPNRNGKQDEIPLSFLGPWDLKFLAHAFGLAANDYNIYVDDAGQVRFMPLEDAFIDFLEALASMYERGLLDEQGFTTADSLRAVTDSDAAVTYGVFFGPNPFHLFAIELGEQYSLLEPLIWQDTRIYRDVFGPISVGAFAITSACRNPAEMLSWADILYTKDGAIQAMAGVEGEDYQWNDDGTWKYAANLETDSSYVLYDLSIYDSGNMPWMFPVDFYAAYELGGLQKTTASLIGLRSYLVSPFPYYYVLSPRQHDMIDPMQQDLGRYVDESVARFVLGELDIHSRKDIDAFRNGLAENGVQEFVAFWQEIYDRQRIR